jgi:3-dehydro-4-phosphotetronate decarboxylase
MNETLAREQIVAYGKSLFQRGLSAGSSGNISARVEDGWLITPTNSSLGTLDPGRLSKLDSEGRHLAGDPPSKEAFLHRCIYERRAGAGAVVHLHATHSAAISCMSGLDTADCIPPLTPYYLMKIGRLPLVPYHRPGDSRLGEIIRGLAGRHAAVLLANHGPVVSGTSLEAAVNAIEELEETAKLFLLLRGHSVRTLTAEEIEDLRTTFRLEL